MVKDPLTGRLVDSRYEIVDQVARGGMATVYRAHDRRLDRIVGFKLMHAHLADSPDFVARFRREARAAARLSNPGVVAVYDQGSLDGVAYLVMEYVEGPTLRDLISTGPLSVREALGLTAQVLRPLGAAHRADLVHRDIKPENVLLPADGSVAKVADFGLARAVTEATQTTTGNVMGTVAYLAPELITAGSSTPRADVFSVGVVVYELLTGEQPFEADSPIQIAFRNVHEDIPRPSALVEGLPESVDELVASLAHRDPALRPANADDALTALRETVSGLSDSELAVRRGGGTDSVRTQEVLTANAEAARTAMGADARSGSADSPQDSGGSTPNGTSPRSPEEDSDTPGAGLRTVSLPIGSIGPDAAETNDGRTRHLSREELAAGDSRETASVAKKDLRSRRGHRPVRRRMALGTAALAVLGGSTAAAWYVLEGPGRGVPVPDIVGQTAEEAQKSVEAAGLSWGAPSRAYSDTVAAGSVISCEPSPGTNVPPDGAVSAVVSRGVEQKTVPDVTGKTQDEASQAITDTGLTVGTISQDYSRDVPTGQVISTDPAAGTNIDHSSPVAMTISRGREPATVPNVVGMTTDQAKITLQAAGLKLGTQTQEFSEDVAKGQVISSSPSAGASGIFRGDSISVTVSKGPEMVTIPDVSGKTKDEAVAALEALGLTVKVSESWGGLFGKARSTDPAAGTSVRKSSTVTLNVS